MITENWKAIKGHEEYEVSDLGRIRKVLEDGTRKELSYGMANVGYAQVNFPDGKAVSLHRLVAQTFIRPIAMMEVVNHKDNVKSNNRLDNLEIVSIGRNISQSVVMRMRSGKKAPPRVLHEKYPCRNCGLPKPAKEVVTAFYVLGIEKIRFKPCVKCRKERQNNYRRPKETA